MAVLTIHRYSHVSHYDLLLRHYWPYNQVTYHFGIPMDRVLRVCDQKPHMLSILYHFIPVNAILSWYGFQFLAPCILKSQELQWLFVISVTRRRRNTWRSSTLGVAASTRDLAWASTAPVNIPGPSTTGQSLSLSVITDKLTLLHPSSETLWMMIGGQKDCIISWVGSWCLLCHKDTMKGTDPEQLCQCESLSWTGEVWLRSTLTWPDLARPGPQIVTLYWWW